jgi:CBS-domain-containing membrane protein
VAKNMGDVQVRRLPVLNRDKRLVGIVSLGDLAKREGKAASKAVSGVSQSGARHNQSARA